MSSNLKHLLIIEDDRGRQKEYILEAPLHSVGRDPTCDIWLQSQFVSRRQATLVQIIDDDGSFHYRIVDGAPKGKPSSNGILVNGQKVRACDLEDRDEIIFGPQIKATYYLSEQDDYRPRFDDTLIPDHYMLQEVSRLRTLS